MAMRIKKRYISFIIIAVVIVGALIWARIRVFDYMGGELKDRIQSANFNGFQVRYDTMRVYWFEKAIEIDNLEVSRGESDTSCLHPERIAIAKMRAEGIGLTRLIFNKTLSVEAFHFDHLKAIIREQSLLEPDSPAGDNNKFKLLADVVNVRHIEMLYTDSASCDTINSMKTHLSITGLNLDLSAEKPFQDLFASIRLDSVEVKAPREFYTFRARQATWDTTEKSFRLDSIDVIPAYGRLEFGRKRGYEVDRFECTVPSLVASGISAAVRDSLDLRIARIDIQFRIKIFRDKRYPFITREKLLPMTLIQRLPFRLTIDSVAVSDSFVQYEEFAAETSEPGGIFFANLNAVLGNVSNTAGDATLQAHAKLFGQGDIDVYVTFPGNPAQRSSLKGSVRNFHLPKLNAILTPSTQLAVETGEMNALLFAFTFNEFRSDGELELNYENLKLASFKNSEKNEEPEVNTFKTFMINTFVFRKNMTKDLPAEKRQGTIDFERDRARSIFNLWTKSLVSGIKSAYNLDTTAKNEKTELRKDEQSSRREARRQKRLARKKDKSS